MRMREIKTEAKECFALNRYRAMTICGAVYTLALNIAVLTTVLFLLSKWAVWYGVVLILLFWLCSAPFSLGMVGFWLRSYRREKVENLPVFDGFSKRNLWRAVLLLLLRFAFWLAFTVLLIVPGVFFALRTSMSVYFLRANPDLKPLDALRYSNRVMKKHTGAYFLLCASFIGWFLLGIVTFGLGLIWAVPYFQTAKAVFYKRVLQGDTATYGADKLLQASVKKEQSQSQDLSDSDDVFIPLGNNAILQDDSTISQSEEERAPYDDMEEMQPAECEYVVTQDTEISYVNESESDDEPIVVAVANQSVLQQNEPHSRPIRERSVSERNAGTVERRPPEREHSPRYSRQESRPLSGTRVVLNERGGRTTEPPAAQNVQVRKEHTVSGATTERKESAPAGETAKERLERLRAQIHEKERNTKNGEEK